MQPFQSWIIALALAPSCLLAQPKWIKVTPENATLVDGTSLANHEGETYWSWRPEEGNGGILESRAHELGGNAPPLRVLADGLEPGADYEVFGYFWAPGFGEESKDKHVNHWPARFGFGVASMTPFGGKYLERIPWIVYAGSKLGSFMGISAVVEESNRLNGLDLIATDGDARLIRARVGVARADAKGQLAVYVDDFPDSIHSGKTRIDGIAIQSAPADSRASAGTGDAQVLHHAMRANDWLSAQRELDAGADLNALDDRGLSTLFHPASCGDQETVKKLLAAGANPDIERQSASPLTAAASTGDAAMVRLLLEAGAELPAGRLEVSETLRAWDPIRVFNKQKIDDALLHPAIAAIRAGSLDTLNVLLEKRPDLDLESLGRVTEPDQKPDGQHSIALFLVEDAMSQGNDELAAFLIDRGCTLSAGTLLNGYGCPKPRPHALLAYAITCGSALEKSLEALLRRGISPIYKLGPPSYSQLTVGQGIQPWDGLSAAVCVANLELTQRFLLQAEGLPIYYEEFLMAMARWHGEPRILSLLTQQFPDAGKSTFQKPSARAPNASAASLRLLLPRTKPAQAIEKPDDGLLTLAVVASPQAGGQGAFLEAEASRQNGWTVVDRMDVDKALREARIADPWGGGEYRFAELGDRMAADLLVLVSMIDGQQIKLLRFEAIDVATGLAVMREHVDSKAFDPEKSAAALLQKIRATILSARAGDRPTAITLLPFSIDPKVWNSHSLLGVFRSAVQAEVDATPGLLSVGMNEIQAVGGEQALGGEGSFWAAAYTLEGGVAALDDGRISLTLRMHSLKQTGDRAVDHTENGQPSEIPLLVAKAWKALVQSPQLGVNAPAVTQDAKQKAAEAARLLREAEWLLASRLYADAVPLLERANLLGATPEPLVQAHYSALIRQITLFRNMQALESTGVRVSAHPLTVSHQQVLLFSLGAAQELLDQMSYYQSRFGKPSLNWRQSPFHNTLIALSFMRASIPHALPDGDSQDVVSRFGESLDQYTAEYFKIRASAKEPTMLPGGRYMSHYPGEPITAAMLRRNPKLLKGWVSLFFAASEVGSKLVYEEELFQAFAAGGTPDQYGKKQLLLDAVAAQMDRVPQRQRALRDAELTYFASHGDARIAAARNYCHVISTQGRTAWSGTRSWIKPDTVLKRFGMSFLGQRNSSEALIPALVHEPHGGNDWIGRSGYDWMTRTHVRLEVIPYGDAKKQIENNSPWRDFERRAEAASKKENKQEAVSRILAEAGRWEMIYGRLIHDGLKEHFQRLYPTETDEGAKDGIEVPLLVDLRTLDPSMPGMFYMPTVDNRNKDRLWLFYQPFEKMPLLDSSPTALRRYPKVVGIDCATGEVKLTADVVNAPGLDPGESDKNSKWLVRHDENFLAQTNDLILTSVRWPGMNYQGAGVSETGVLIRKDNGQLIGLDTPVAVRELMNLPYGTAHAFGAVAVGNQFISARQLERGDGRVQVMNQLPHELIKIAPDGTVTPLSQYGRRPQVSPFDAIDRRPQMMVPDGNRVLVIHDWNHAARYSPATDTWQMCEETSDELAKSTKLKVDRDFRHHIFSCHRIPKSDATPEIIIQWDQTFPDMLALSKRGQNIRRIKIHLEMPEGFAEEIVYSFKARDSENQFVSYAHHKGTNRFAIVVLHQTKTHVILATQVGNGFAWSAGKRSGEYLPLLWAVPIKELQETLMMQD